MWGIKKQVKQEQIDKKNLLNFLKLSNILTNLGQVKQEEKITHTEGMTRCRSCDQYYCICKALYE